MNDGTSLYDVSPERLDQLVFKALQDSQGDDAPPKASLNAVLEQVGSQIGCYKLLSILGEGGMGSAKGHQARHGFQTCECSF